jgi:hypothetical protein
MEALDIHYARERARDLAFKKRVERLCNLAWRKHNDSDIHILLKRVLIDWDSYREVEAKAEEIAKQNLNREKSPS